MNRLQSVFSLCWLAVLLVVFVACQKNDNQAQPTPGTAPETPVGESAGTTAPPQILPTTTPGIMGYWSFSDPTNDCLTGREFTPVPCATGREFEKVEITFSETALLFDLQLVQPIWQGEEDYLLYILFDTDKNNTTGEQDYVYQYGVAPELTLAVSWLDQTFSLTLLSGTQTVSLPSTNAELLDDRTLRLRLPLRYAQTYDFDLAMFILGGTDPTRDAFPSDGKLRLPEGEIIPK